MSILEKHGLLQVIDEPTSETFSTLMLIDLIIHKGKYDTCAGVKKLGIIDD